MDQLADRTAHISQRIMQIVADLANKPFSELRILDLGCGDAYYSLELARRGASIVATDARESVLDQARVRQQAFDLANVQFVMDDVRNLERGKYGGFDVVLCLGIFYHLDAPDVFRFASQIASVCDRMLILETHISLTPAENREYGQWKYWGWSYREHAPDTSLEVRKESEWASIDNVNSFWLTLPSLCNLLADSGFTSILEVRVPPHPAELGDRVMLIAVRGDRDPRLDGLRPHADRLPEHDIRPLTTLQPAPLLSPYTSALLRTLPRRAARAVLPARLLAALKRIG